MHDSHRNLLCPIRFVELVEVWARSPDWFERAAAEMVQRGRYGIIKHDASPYMFRCWLHGWRMKPQLGRTGTHEPDTSCSHLLHCTFRRDNDHALHDHPWDFESEILKGGYTEALPSKHWVPGSALGPCPAGQFKAWTAGDRIQHAATDLHLLHNIIPGTWTSVRTGPYLRPWGFHPMNRPWVAAEAYTDDALDVGEASHA